MAEKPDRKAWWGRGRPLTRSDLTDDGSIARLFAYGVERGRLVADQDETRFWTLCLYCARKGKQGGGALLTAAAFGHAAVQWYGTGEDEDEAKRRLARRKALERGPAAPPEAARLVAGMGLPSGIEAAASTEARRLELARRAAAERAARKGGRHA